MAGGAGWTRNAHQQPKPHRTRVKQTPTQIALTHPPPRAQQKKNHPHPQTTNKKKNTRGKPVHQFRENGMDVCSRLSGRREKRTFGEAPSFQIQEGQRTHANRTLLTEIAEHWLTNSLSSRKHLRTGGLQQ